MKAVIRTILLDPEARGRWIPTTSVEQYADTLAYWFGLESNDVNYVFRI